MMIQTPSARVAIVAPDSGVMASHFQRAIQALCGEANGLFAGAVSGSAFTIQGISNGSSLIRITFDLVPATDNVSLYLFARTGLGTTVADYSWSRVYNDAATTAASVTDTSDTQIILAAAVQSDADIGGVHGEITISNIQSSRYKRAGGWVTHYDGSRERSNAIAATISTRSPLTGLSLSFSSGDIASGHARVEAP